MRPEWHDKQYKKVHLGRALKANPFGGTSHARELYFKKKKVGVKAKQLNTALGSMSESK